MPGLQSRWQSDTDLKTSTTRTFRSPAFPNSINACLPQVLEIRGNRNAVLLTTHIVLVAVRGNMARGQLMFNYSLPANAPPPTPRSHPPAHVHLGPPGKLALYRDEGSFLRCCIRVQRS